MTEKMDIADALERAADLIEPEGAWGQGFYRRRDGRLCAADAIWLIEGRRWDDAFRFFTEFVGPVGTWNDAPERTQAEVVAKLREAAVKARGEQSS
jgi:hypothetical protein